LHRKNVLDIPFRQALDDLYSVVDLLLYPWGNLVISGDILGCHSCRGGCSWHLVGSAQGNYQTAYSAYCSPHNKESSSSNVNSMEAKKPRSMLLSIYTPKGGK
jgi:hypothetical protein